MKPASSGSPMTMETHRTGGFLKWWIPNSWLVYFMGKSQPKMDDDWGYPYDSGNLHFFCLLPIWEWFSQIHPPSVQAHASRGCRCWCWCCLGRSKRSAVDPSGVRWQWPVANSKGPSREIWSPQKTWGMCIVMEIPLKWKVYFMEIRI